MDPLETRPPTDAARTASSDRTSPGEVWHLLDSPPGQPAWNMAIDDVLLANAASNGRPVLRFYRWTEPAATFGYSQRYAAVATLTTLRPLIRRPTGGGLVPHDADWTYSVTIPPDHPWYGWSAVESYRRMHEWLRRAFAECGVATELAPCCNPAGPGQCFVGAEKHDLLLNSRKIAGAAQRRNRQGLLIQGSVQPPGDLARSTWQNAMAAVGPGGSIRFTPWALPEGQWAAAAALASSRYDTAAYNERR